MRALVGEVPAEEDLCPSLRPLAPNADPGCFAEGNRTGSLQDRLTCLFGASPHPPPISRPLAGFSSKALANVIANVFHVLPQGTDGKVIHGQKSRNAF